MVAGGHPDFAAARDAMTGVQEIVYRPQAESQAVYQQLYRIYQTLHDAFGGVTTAADLGGVMKELLALKARQSL